MRDIAGFSLARPRAGFVDDPHPWHAPPRRDERVRFRGLRELPVALR